MLESRSAEWGDKVRIIGVSIDDSTDTVVKHVKAKGWEKVEHLHRASSTCDDDYGVQGVPHVVLVDGKGKIVYVGHPATRELEKDIDTLLSGEKLTGQGTAPAGGAEADEEGETYQDLDLATVKEEMDRFAEAVKSLASNEAVKSKVDSMMRDIIVLVRQSKYDAESDKFLTSYQNVNVLVGPQDAIDAIKPALDEFITGFGGTFKKVDRVQVV